MRHDDVQFAVGLTLVLITAFISCSSAADREAWRSRTVYQVLTDRFSTDQCYGTFHGDSNTYTGGTWAGMRKQIGYVKDLGFDAVWISPFTQQGSDAFGMSGYAGYWPADFYQTNPAFGSSEQLQQLVADFRANNVLLLFDLVINHVGYGDYESYSPFNSSSDFHDCNGCFTLNCAQDPAGMFAAGAVSAHSYEHCKLSGLPDLNHSDPTVLSRMLAWQSWAVDTFAPDGLRYDAAHNSLRSFVANLSAAAGNGSLWTIGELYLEDPLKESAAYIADWVAQNVTHAAFSFPMQKALRLSIRERKRNMTWLAQQRQQHLQLFGERVHDMGSFIENHDMHRWLDEGYSDHSRYMNGLAYILFLEGIPFVYYGAEHGFTQERQPLWESDFAHNTGLWLFLKTSVHYRQAARVWQAGIGTLLHADADTLVLQRGPFVLVLTSVGEDPGRPDSRSSSSSSGSGGVMSVAGLPARFAGRSLSNIYNPQDTLQVSRGGVAVFRPAPDGRPQVFYLGAVVDPMSLYIPVKNIEQQMKQIFAVFIALVPPTLLLTLLAMHCWAVRQLRLQQQQHGWHSGLAKTLLSCCTGGLDSKGGNSSKDICLDVPSQQQANDNGFKAAAAPASHRSRSRSHSPSKQQPGNVWQWFSRLTGLVSRRAGKLAASTHASAAAGKAVTNSSSSVSQLSEVKSLWGVDEPARSSNHSRLRQTSMRQILAGSNSSSMAGRQQIASGDAGANSSSSSSAVDRFEVFAGFSAVFKDASRVSAVDLAQGLGMQEYAALQQQHSDRSAGHSAELPPVGAAGAFEARSVVLSQLMPSLTVLRSSLSSTAASRASGPRVASSLSTGEAAAAAAAAVGSPAASSPAAAAAGAAAAEDGLVAVLPAAPLAGALPSRTHPAPLQPTCSSSSTAAAAATPFDPLSTTILHVALEYALPQYGLSSQLMYGGLGMVVASFLKEWPGPLALMAPLYKACYEPLPGTGSKDAGDCDSAAGCGGRVGPDGVLRPSFIPDDVPALLEMSVDVAGRKLPVEVFKLTQQQQQGGGGVQLRTYYLVQSDLFRGRSRGDIYSFADEDEMLAWLAVFNQAVAAVVVAEGVSHMQLHDYHGGLSLMHIPEWMRPAVLYVAHNAHYDATFPIPTGARRNKVYECLGLNAEQAAAYVEHNGSLDMLRCVVSYLRRAQAGHGVVAVSPRYARQIAEKLSVFWALSPVGRPKSIAGILNALDITDSMAASGLTLDQVLLHKAQAKAQLQATYGLTVSEQYSLAVFVGRVTHQKGVDIIAEAAPYMMARHPQLQLVVVGPTGDAVGAAASAALAELSRQYPDRMYCPQDYYVAGDEKHMLLAAADFCLVPSRFEPCGLVDIEFGWNGALMIGHDTGGLGKMPGVYFTAQASHLAHLARKLEAAADEAMALSPQQRRDMAGQALARRFPAGEMMAAYAGAWQQIDRHYRATQRQQRRRREYLHDHAHFFANKWARVNKRDAQPAASAGSKLAHPAAAAAAAAQAAAKASEACQVLGPLGGPRAACVTRYNLLARSSNAASLTADSAAFAADAGGGSSSRPPWWCCSRTAWAVSQGSFPAAQRLSNMLLVVLQYWGLGPGVLLCTFMLLQDIRVNVLGQCGLHPTDSSRLRLAMLPLQGSLQDMLVPRLLLFFILSTVSAPLWFLLASRLRPITYIRCAATLIAACYGLAFVAMHHVSSLLDASLVPVAVFNLVGSPLLSLGYLGEDDVEVSEVGRRMLAISEVTKYVLLCSGMALAAAATTAIPHALVGGVCLLLSLALAVWFWHPMSLSKAYRHLALTYTGQFELLKHLSCFWLTLAASTCDSVAMVLTGFLVITVTNNLAVFASFQAIAFGCCAAAVLWNYRLLCSRAAELRLNAALLGLAAMPFYEFFKAIVLMAFSASTLVPGAPNTGAMLGVSAALDLAMGGRSAALGLAGFVTLPSREVVSIWQAAAIGLGTASVLLTLGLSKVVQQQGGATNSVVLFALVGCLEAVRGGCMLLLARRYPRENLSAP